MSTRTDTTTTAGPTVPGDGGLGAPPPTGEPVQVPERASIGDRLRHLLASGSEAEPLYPRLLQLKNVHPNGWQRAALVEGMVLVGGLAALADRATSWAPLILPVVAAVVVKFHDVLVGVLPRHTRHHDDP
jgi:hypothetical protein